MTDPKEMMLAALAHLHTDLVEKMRAAIAAMEPGDKGLAAVMEVARKLLADHDFSALPVEGSPTGKLADDLKKYPFDPRTEGQSH